MKRLLIAVAVLAAIVVPTQALGSSHELSGEYSVFGECPLSDATLLACLYSESNGGFFQIGEKTVPLKKPVVLQGGLKEGPEGEGIFVAAENGETLVKTPQTVPGGLLGVEAPEWWPLWLQAIFNNYIDEGLTGVTATVELAGPASDIEVSPTNLLEETGTALGLPVKIKLSNAFLGSNCYIGSNKNPVVIDFTTGTTSPPPPNTSIEGDAGTLSFGEEEVLIFSGGKLVNNSFAAPGAKGCGGLFSLFVDPFVNALVGLPAPAGTNTAILEGKIDLGFAELARAHE